MLAFSFRYDIDFSIHNLSHVIRFAVEVNTFLRLFLGWKKTGARRVLPPRRL